MVYWRFMASFAPLRAPLNKKLNKGERFCFHLNTVKREVVDSLTEIQVTKLVLALQRLAGPYTVDTNECNTQIGCVL